MIEAEPGLSTVDAGASPPGDLVVVLVDGEEVDDPAAPFLRVHMGGVAGEGAIGPDCRIGDLIEAIRSLVVTPRRVLALDGGSGVGRRRRALTPRELDVLRLMGTGHTAGEVGSRLGISTRAVENAKRRIFEKLGVQSQTRAVASALRQGLLAVPARDRTGP